MKKLNSLVAVLATTAGMMAASTAMGAGIISNGTVALGVKDSGALNVGGGSTIYGPSFTSPGSGTTGGTGVRGLFVNGTSGYEATFPGCTCEGWGVAVASEGITGWDGNGTSNLTVLPSTFGTDGGGNGTATTVVTIADGGTPALRVTHEYKPSASEFLYEVNVTIENISGRDLGSGMTDLRYTRLMDWDTEPTPFSEFVTISGNGATNLLSTSDDGFESANPLFATSSIAACAPVSTDFVDCGPTDHGARFDFGFDALLAADAPESDEVMENIRTFTIFYGAAPSETAALAALAAVEAEDVFSFGQCNPSSTACGGPDSGEPITYIFGFKGVGGTVIGGDPTIPEPGSLALLGLGLLGFVGTRRMRSHKAG